MKSVIWVLVNSNSRKQAEKIGRAILKYRLAACFGIYLRTKSVYFWPPGKNRLEKSSGPLLVLETLSDKYHEVSDMVKKLHSDEMPFIGKITIDGVSKEFYNWMEGEIK